MAWRGFVPRTSRLFAAFVISLMLPTVFAGSASAQTNLVKNGDFSKIIVSPAGAPSSFQFGSGYTSAETLSDWSTSGYNFVFLPNTADVGGAVGNAGVVKLWGPNDNGGIANGLPTSSPTGTNFVAADGAYQVSAITQQVSGLIVGQKVAVSFAWAGAQQSGFTGPTTDEWTVDLGSSPAQTTSLLSLPSHGASAWVNQTFTFVATSSTELLSFLATGTPSGQPPFALLANVSVTNVPEPASVVMLLTALAGLTGVVRRRGARSRIA